MKITEGAKGRQNDPFLGSGGGALISPRNRITRLLHR
jgi:hypothetical protein